MLEGQVKNCCKYSHFQLSTSWQLERSTNFLEDKILDLETVLKWSERSGSTNWWKMSFLVLKTIATKVTQTKAKPKVKSLNMTALKNVKKLLESGLSAPNPRKQLRPNMCLSFRTLILELFKALGDWKKWSSSSYTFSGTPKCVWCFTQESVLDFLRNGNHQVIISMLPSLFARMDQLSTQQQIGLLFACLVFES